MKVFRQVKKNQKGFTLLEILVVISIIGILIVLGAAAFSVAQQKGRDARRRGDMKAMQNAFEQYYAASGSVYAAGNCTGMQGQFSSNSLPKDPKPSQDYTCTSTTSTYCACALLDETGSGNANTAGSGGTCSYGGTNNYYCVSNLQ